MNVEYSVEFYVTSTGRCPVREFLLELKTSNPDDFAAIVAGYGDLSERERGHG